MWRSVKHEEIQRVYKDHIFLSYRNVGGSRKLVGDVVIVVFLVNDSESHWTDADKKRYKALHLAAMRTLKRAATQHGVNLRLRNAYAEVTLPMDCSRENYAQWSQSVIQQYGKKTIPDYQKAYKANYKLDEAPILFIFNKPLRSMAVSVTADTRGYGELAMITSQCRQRTIIHELLHQFGARDLYYPLELRDLVSRMCYSSIMAADSTYVIDPLTAYLIGWTDEIDWAAEQILNCTKHYTHESMREMIKAEWKRKTPI